MDEGSHEVGLTFPAKAEYISLCRLALAGVSLTRALPEETLGDLKLALTEACSNSVRHAYDPEDGGVVEVRFAIGSDSIAVEVTDDGRGLDARGGPNGIQDPGRLDESGLGLAIIRAVTDEMRVEERAPGRGSRLRFVKRFGA